MARYLVPTASEAAENSRRLTLQFASVVGIFSLLHVLMWGQVIQFIFDEHPPHIRPMLQLPFSVLMALVSGLVGFIISIRQMFLAQRLHAVTTLSLACIPTILCIATVWLVIDFLGVPFAP